MSPKPGSTPLSTPVSGSIRTAQRDDVASSLRSLRDQLEEVMRVQIANEALRVYCRASRSSAQALTTATQTAINMTATDYDTAGAHDTVTNNTRLTILSAGVYAVGAYLKWASNATGIRTIEIQKNGATVLASDDYGAVNAVMSQTATSQENFLRGDYIEVYGTQTSGGNLNVTAAHIWAHRVAD